MKNSCLAIFIAVSMVACATKFETTSSATDSRWNNRGIAELIDVIGPFDTTTIKGDSRTYNWFRFGNCRLTAYTNLDDKIQKVELAETGQGCDVYRQKLGG
jgi:hypothetical protein